RLSVFTQGCPHHCVGCQNPDTHAASGGRDEDTENILARIDENPLLTGITFSGGEPFLQPAPLTRLAKEAHKRGLDVWSYTGYTLEELLAKKNPAIDALLRELDVLVDGPYEERLRDLTLNFRGSSNQRIIDMNAFRKTGKIRTLEF
ncbi:MAG: anaerobic ribonucleoside-triphosphate reductase activating protein, partial [Selenomonas sp.]|nr:anaerobic ribonucleoside-triphosphate reductase activating protein [Selenomonas sp.]